jgi:outer membrane protein, heavy metal efflux system
MSSFAIRWGVICLTLTPVFTSQAGAQPSGFHTESSVVDAVIARNYAVQAARVGADAAAERPGQVRRPSPMVEVMPMPLMTLDGEPGAQIMVRQPIAPRSRLRADRTARRYMAEAEALMAEHMEHEQIYMARMAYIQLWSLREQAARIDSFRAGLETYQEVALAQYRAGRGPQQAVLNIRTEGEMLKQRLETLREEEAGYIAAIIALTGGTVVIGQNDRLIAPEDHPLEPVRVYREMLRSHAAITAGEAMQSAEAAMADMSRTMLRPEFTVGVNVNASRMAFQRMYGQEPVMPSVGLMVPLWRDGIRAEIREAELRGRQRELETEHTRLTLESEVVEIVIRIQRVRERIARYENDLRPQVQQTLEATLSGYQTGMMRFLELLDTQRMALEVEIDLVMARMQEAMLFARLDNVTGINHFEDIP